jgi:hypothetical protein
MLKRVDKILIGKDISRTASLILYKTDGTPNLADGEVVVLDKDMKILVAGATISDTDTIYIIQGTGDTYAYADADGTAVTGVRRFVVSDPIEGALVKSWKGVSYATKAEQVSSYVITGMTPVVGTEYIIRIVYKDLKEHPGQFTQTYRYVSTTATLDTFGAAIVAKITAHAGSRVTATYTSGTDTIAITGKAIPECTTALTDIDKFSQVEFDLFFNYVTSTGDWAEWPVTTPTVVATTALEHGQGTWEQVRDLEKAQKGYRGFTNRTTFPVKEPTTYTVKDETYDLLVIESDKSYESSDAWNKQAPLTQVIAIPYTATSNQMDAILAVLNPWFASCPGAFNVVAV